MKQFSLVTIGLILLSLGAVAEGSEDSKVVYKVEKEQINISVVLTSNFFTGPDNFALFLFYLVNYFTVF